MIEELCAQLAASEAALTDVTRKWEAAEQEVTDMRDDIDAAWSEITDNPDIKRGGLGELQEGIRAACDAAYAQGQEEPSQAVADLLRAYLISQGLPADPVRLDDPHLDALAAALL